MKIKSLLELKRIIDKLKKKDKKIVFTNGCFDLLHPGHIYYLKAARKKGDILILGLNSDSSVRKLKGKGRPLIPERERAEILSNLECVDYISIFQEETPERLIREISPDILVKGGDYRRKEVVGRKFVEEKGGKVIIIPFLKGYSTTKLIKKIKRL
ncbi:MAG: D-glycero-beta-D-manno-heptose 1-phosphate adenylyltransferase [Candidatus Omnitrophica bacterium]|nr:D-glycero-beta-D-manno-heptose 1-phosphate adenylyltransferase [Candidatus Omnitrophota bacterium]